ncbi:hypothetical protein A3A38_02645 [Candidatus Kaiserbacteria bacterium RIFCSPLOWO2_01_FULL_53_17]|uniref:Uncharacterized protein n=1 Tax=Candidatus Kaiserbacteria bacterium RIFCSPLOWO2_01_FULL_53_17 TaxID=1798511 RepID=A0A1F6EGS2_9BACT|nr:MAG: hypothetical protein A3A38_02645 [Candidatus Kaiserbacteria bacterium RIFCSPLOWO2_01_FULL_53_17]
MNQKILLGSLFVFSLLIIPSVTFAAWYNPFTWFTPVAPQSEIVLEEQTIPTTTPIATAASDPVIQYVEKPVIKEVVKTVTQTVEDPIVRQQLQDALAKNTQLTNQIQEYQNLVKQYESANQQLNSKYADAVGVAAQCVAALKTQSTYTPPPTIRCTSNTSTMDGTTFTICN